MFRNLISDYYMLNARLNSFPFQVPDSVLEIWNMGRLFEPDFNKPPHAESWVNVCIHCVIAADLGARIAMQSLEYFSDISVEHVGLALLIHDWNKRFEVEYSLGAKNIDEINDFNRNCANRLSTKIDESIIKLSLCTGDLGCEIFYDQGFNASQYIVFYADACTSNDKVVGPLERLRLSEIKMSKQNSSKRADDHFRYRYGKSWKECNYEIISKIEEWVSFEEVKSELGSKKWKPSP